MSTNELAVNPLTIWTIGHSTHSLEDFIARLDSFRIKALADVRSFPASRRHPHFNKEELRNSLATSAIEYRHLPDLGGRRRAKPDSVNMAWRNESFRGYADYMETEGFRLGVRQLLELASRQRTAIMCAEALWWRCHRSMIADYLKSTGVEVIHILAPGKTEPHRYTGAAQIVNGELSYRGLLGN